MIVDNRDNLATGTLRQFMTSYVTLQWKGGSPGQTFQLQLARNREFSPLLKEEKLAEPKIQLQRPAGSAFFVRVGVIDPDGFVAPYGPTQQIDVARNYWPFLLFLPLLFL